MRINFRIDIEKRFRAPGFIVWVTLDDRLELHSIVNKNAIGGLTRLEQYKSLPWVDCALIARFKRFSRFSKVIPEITAKMDAAGESFRSFRGYVKAPDLGTDNPETLNTDKNF